MCFPYCRTAVVLSVSVMREEGDGLEAGTQPGEDADADADVGADVDADEGVGSDGAATPAKLQPARSPALRRSEPTVLQPPPRRRAVPRCAPVSPRRAGPVRTVAVLAVCDPLQSAGGAATVSGPPAPSTRLSAWEVSRPHTLVQSATVMIDCGVGPVDPVVAQRLLGQASEVSPRGPGSDDGGLAELQRLVACLREGGVPVLVASADRPGSPAAAAGVAAGDPLFPTSGMWAPPQNAAARHQCTALRCLLLYLGRRDITPWFRRRTTSPLAGALRIVAAFLGASLPLTMSQRARRELLYASIPPHEMRQLIAARIARGRLREQGRRQRAEMEHCSRFVPAPPPPKPKEHHKRLLTHGRSNAGLPLGVACARAPVDSPPKLRRPNTGHGARPPFDLTRLRRGLAAKSSA
eukprot:TRINITY_DN15941_c0_g1_i3.p1 TRINITY_DN15941_c0_g1~~TRINITY_DN15941_c0_g1_i3.p1  ORF type:complete len:409 (+),score=72.97 TRINITY_DN15941_c0_g1_i3:673-1899(+)